MCLVVPAQVVSVSGATAEVLLHGARLPISVSTELAPDVRPGDFALVDRGMILRIIEPDEAEAILSIYAEMEQLLEREESLHA